MKLVPFRTVASIQLGKMLSPKAKMEVMSFPYLRNQNVQWGFFQLDEIATMNFSERERAKFELRPGDLLVCEGGEPGRCAVWSGEIQVCYYQKALHRVRPFEGVADSEFLAYWLRYRAGSGAFEDQNAKTTIAHLPMVRLQELGVPSMGIDKQKLIAARIRDQLVETQTAERAADQQVGEFAELLAAMYRDAFRRIAPIAVPPAFGEPPCGWRWHKLGDLARLESGHTPSRSRPDWWGGEVSWLSLTEIRALDGCWVERTALRTNAAGIANSAARILPRGTVCFSRTASVGFVAIMAQPMATSQDFANWVCGDELDPEFLMHALIRCRKELRELATGATHKTIYMPTLESFHVCAPPLAEQRRIVAVLKQQLAEVASLRAALDVQAKELAALPQRILAQAFNP